MNVLTAKHSAAKEIRMSNITTETATPAAAAQSETEIKPKKPVQASKPAKKAKASKKAKAAAKQERAKPGAERSNKKAEVIALMKRAKGATLADIMELTAWQKHTVRGFVSILGKKGEHTIESSNNDKGERTYRIAK